LTIRRAVVLAAGRGLRLGELTEKMPKVMLPLDGKPLLEHLINWLRSYNILEIIINVHYMPQSIIQYFGDGRKLGVKIQYSKEEEILGTAGALDRIREQLNDRFVVTYGDLLTNVDLNAFTKWHITKSNDLSMTVYKVEDPTRAGIVQMDAEGRLLRFHEKPSRDEAFSNLANAGIFVFEPKILQFVPHDKYFDIGHDLIPTLLRNGVNVHCYPISEYLLDIGGIERYNQAQRDLASGRLLR
jgi:NDP-sugar pyrophosphorylase family protein